MIPPRDIPPRDIPPRDIEVTTVADDMAVLHAGTEAHRFVDLAPGQEHDLLGQLVCTLDRPGGALLARVATVNDVHFGEVECGRIDDHTDGPILRADPGADPYPEVMNRAAVAEIVDVGVDALVVKGDLTTDGTDDEFAAFEACYREPFGDRLHVVRGNHDSYRGQDRYAGDRWIELPGLTIGLIDTVLPTATTGSIRHTQLDELDARLAADPDGAPVLLMGHHPPWIGGPDSRRNDDYFGLHPDASDALDELCARHRRVLAYTAGHTHRHRVRTMTRSGVPAVEIGCVKDFPGTWAEYRVYRGAVMQVVHRISAPAALDWSERCRHLYADFGVDYQAYALGRLEDRCFVLPDRRV